MMWSVRTVVSEDSMSLAILGFLGQCSIDVRESRHLGERAERFSRETRNEKCEGIVVSSRHFDQRFIR